MVAVVVVGGAGIVAVAVVPAEEPRGSSRDCRKVGEKGGGEENDS